MAPQPSPGAQPPTTTAYSSAINFRPSDISSTDDMATLSENPVFESLLQSALEDYEKQTGINLVGHPLAVQLDGCDSVDSINDVLQEQARSFREFRGSDNKIMKSLRRAVQVLHKLSGTAVFGEAIGLVRRIGQLVLHALSDFSPTAGLACEKHTYRHWNSPGCEWFAVPTSESL